MKMIYGKNGWECTDPRSVWKHWISRRGDKDEKTHSKTKSLFVLRTELRKSVHWFFGRLLVRLFWLCVVCVTFFQKRCFFSFVWLWITGLMCSNFFQVIQCDMNRDTTVRCESKSTLTDVRWSFLILLHWGLSVVVFVIGDLQIVVSHVVYCPRSVAIRELLIVEWRATSSTLTCFRQITFAWCVFISKPFWIRATVVFGSEGTRTITEKTRFRTSSFWIWHATDQNCWFRDIILSLHVSNSLAPNYRSFGSLKKANRRHFACRVWTLVQLLLVSWAVDFRFSLWLDARVTVFQFRFEYLLGTSASDEERSSWVRPR